MMVGDIRTQPPLRTLFRRRSFHFVTLSALVFVMIALGQLYSLFYCFWRLLFRAGSAYPPLVLLFSTFGLLSEGMLIIPPSAFRWTPDMFKIWTFCYLSALSSITTFVSSVIFCNTKFGYSDIELCPECLPPSAIPVLVASFIEVILWMLFFAIYRSYKNDRALSNLLVIVSLTTCVVFFLFFEDLTYFSEPTFAVTEDSES